MQRRTFLTAAAAPFVRTARAASKRTNVVMFMTDDHGAWTLGSYGCKDAATPNLDALAAGGARFDRAFACTPVCSPSRMTWLTGRIPSTHRVQDWLRPEDSFGPNARKWTDGHPTYSEHLAKAGYTLGMCGKWHMGNDRLAQKGFTYWATIPGGGGSYKDAEFVVNGSNVKTTGYKTDRVTDFALDFLNQHRGKEDPFYLLIPYYAPHTPYDYQPEEYRKPFADSKFSCYPGNEMHPWQNRGLSRHHGNRDSMHAYSALIRGVDVNVGRIVKRLEEMGERENTLIVFTADQGWSAGHHGVWGKGNGTWPFNIYDGGSRVPLIWNHPGKIKGGQTLRSMVSSYDYFPTILDYLGVKTPPDPKRPGRSYAGFLRGQNPRWQNRLYFEYAYARAVRTENLKLIQRIEKWPSELFDLEADPGETRNLIADPAYKKQADTLRTDLGRFFSRMGAPGIEEWQSTTHQQLTGYQAVERRNP